MNVLFDSNTQFRQNYPSVTKNRTNQKLPSLTFNLELLKSTVSIISKMEVWSISLLMSIDCIWPHDLRRRLYIQFKDVEGSRRESQRGHVDRCCRKTGLSIFTSKIRMESKQINKSSESLYIPLKFALEHEIIRLNSGTLNRHKLDRNAKE